MTNAIFSEQRDIPRKISGETTLFRQHLGKGNVLKFRTLGSSMSPFVRSGDVVHVAATEEFAVGDVLLYEREQSWYVHRLIQIGSSSMGDRCYILRGDSLLVPDPPIQAEQVLGRVIAIERKGRLIQPNRRLYPLWHVVYSAPLFRNVILPRMLQLLTSTKRHLLSSRRD
ncbi:MAG: hypothetical protein AAF614_33995 [Chloroflexota bacterium]